MLVPAVISRLELIRYKLLRPSLVLIAQAIFPLQYRHTQRCY